MFSEMNYILTGHFQFFIINPQRGTFRHYEEHQGLNLTADKADTIVNTHKEHELRHLHGDRLEVQSLNTFVYLVVNIDMRLEYMLEVMRCLQ